MGNYNKDSVGEFRARYDELYKSFDIETKTYMLKEEQSRTQDPDFWLDIKAAQAQMKKIADMRAPIGALYEIKKLIDDFEFEIYCTEEGLFSEEEINAVGQTIEERLQELETQKMLSNEGDDMNASLKIVAGAGGTEAQDWAHMLARMYDMWCTEHGFTCDKFNWQEGDPAGIKTCTLTITGKNAYGLLKGENGVHRLVRVSPYNAQGKRMTSFASVFVVPVVDDSIEVEIDESKATYDYFRSGGAGGQNVNKVSSGVRVHYMFKDPYTGEEEEIIVENTETRDQPKNKENCRRLLRSILYNKELQHRLEEKKKVEDSKRKIEWGSQIRSYVFDDRRVKDHRTGCQTSDVDAVMNGDIDDFLKAYLLM